MRKLFVWMICIVGLFICTTCQLMPEEDVLPDRHVIGSYKAEAYKMTAVMRGDLVLSKTVNCTYVPAREESYSFSLGSMYIDKIHVSVGDQVKAGQVLAQLELSNLQEQIAAENYQLSVLELKKLHITENRDLDLRKHDIILEELEREPENTEEPEANDLSAQIEAQKKLRAETAKDYADQLQAAEDAIYIQKLRMEEIEGKLKERRIVAEIDGTVTYVRSISDGQRSVKGQNILTISDLDSTVFKVTGKDAAYFSAGQEVTVLCQGKEYAAYVADAAELDIPEDEDASVVYLRLKQPDPTLEDGARGKITFLLEQREDTLYVDKDTVRTSNGTSFVYVLDEAGMRTMQEVTTGLLSGGFIEIIDGLQEHDRVILD